MSVFMAYSPDFQMAFITTDWPHFQGSMTFTQNTRDLVREVQALVNSIGIGGSANEKGMEMLDQALSTNGRWFRQGAQLVAIFLTDEDDWSLRLPSYYAQSYDSYYSQGMFYPFAIIGDVPGGCTGAFAGHDYAQLTSIYNTQWWSICADDWGLQMEDIAMAIVNSSAYTLDHVNPKIETITVFVNGQEVESGWNYIEDSNTIVFDWDSVPDEGDTVDISYEIWECE